MPLALRRITRPYGYFALALIAGFWAHAPSASIADEAAPAGPSLTEDTFANLSEKTLPSVVAVYVKNSIQDQLRELQEQDPLHRKFFEDPRFKKFFEDQQPKKGKSPQSPGAEPGKPGDSPGPEGETPSPEDDGPDDEKNQVKTSGSGVIISRDGYIVTNLHIVNKAKEGTLSVILHDDTEIEGDKVKIIATDDLIDLAILKIDASGHDLPPIGWGDSDKMRIGDFVVAIGNPLDLRGTVSKGIISAKSRKIDKSPIEHLLQTDAVINPGNSGGALVNLRGELIGIDVAIATNSGFFQGIGFAIPSNDARFVADQVIEHGRVRRGYIGIHMSPLDSEMVEALGLKGKIKQGIVVTDVLEGAPAGKAGVRAYDVIIRVDEVQIKETGDLLGVVAGKKVGDKARLTVLRGGAEGKPREVSMEMEVTERPSTDQIGKQQEDLRKLQNRTTPEEEPAKDPVSRMGLKLKGFTMGTIHGVEVTAVRADSPASLAQIQVGDIILEINRQEVKTVEEFTKALGSGIEKGRKSFLIRLLQDGRYTVKSLQVGE